MGRIKVFLLCAGLSLIALAGVVKPASAVDLAQPAERPFGLPFNEPTGPDTWLLGQVYGNTSGAYRQRETTYNAGQGVHFGVDLMAPCGYPIVAIGDGVVSKVDAMQHPTLIRTNML